MRYLAGLIAGVTTTWWLLTGAQAGWTKTSVPVTYLDEITGIEGIKYEDRFVPGIDFLGAGLVGAGLLFAVTLIPLRKQNRQTH